MNPSRLKKALLDGIGHHREGRFDKAEEIYSHLRVATPDNYHVLYLSGLNAHDRGRSDDAIGFLSRALWVDPKSAGCKVGLGLAVLAKGDTKTSEGWLRSALDTEPDNADAWEALALCLKIQDRLDEAVACHRRVVSLRPKDAMSWCNFGLTLRFQGSQAEALQCQERALASNPACVPARFARAQALQHMSLPREAVAEYDGVLRESPFNFEAMSYRLLALHYLDGVSRERLFEEHLAFGKIAGKAGVRAFSNDRNPSRKLRIAFLSQDFRSHSCAYFIEPILRELDRTQFEVVLYFDHFREDAVSLRLKTHASVWRNFVGVSGAEVERTIRADAPDILVDLTGHTSMVSRLPLLAGRLAPVQVNYLGYPDTSGVEAMDYRFTDDLADPAPEADGFATEQLVRFSPSAWSYQPPADSPEVAAVRGERGSYVTFGCFNYLGKITDPMLLIWGRLLSSVPRSRLLLKGSGLETPAIKERFVGRLRGLGIDPAPFDFIGRTASTGEHLALYNRVSIALDTFPYNGTTTTCEALWMGIPVVTLKGDRHASRVGASLLTNIGHAEWIARDAEEYVGIASILAASPECLEGVKARLRGDISKSPVMDHAAQASRFGVALRSCWQDYCLGGRLKQAG